MTVPTDRVLQLADQAMKAAMNRDGPRLRDFLLHLSGGKCESPIEQLLSVALLAVRSFNNLDPEYVDEKLIQLPDGCYIPEPGLHIQHQVQISQYRADFVVFYVDTSSRFLTSIKEWTDPVRYVVECDGHAFHQRTKEESKKEKRRDRYMQSLGHKVYRYTGSELHKDPFDAAMEVAQAASDMILDDPRGYL